MSLVVFWVTLKVVWVQMCLRVTCCVFLSPGLMSVKIWGRQWRSQSWAIQHNILLQISTCVHPDFHPDFHHISSSYIFIIYVHIVLDAACKTTCKAQSGRNLAKTSDDTSNGDDALRMLRADRGCFEALQLNRWSNRSGSGGRCRIRSQSFDLTRHMPRLPREGLSKTRHGGMAAWRHGACLVQRRARCRLGNVVRTPLKECSAVLNLLSIFSIFSMKNLSIFSEDGTLGHSCPSSHHSCSHMRPNLEAEFCDDFRCCNLQ